MPRSMLIDPDKKASAILFGSRATAANLSAVSRATGISVSTLSDYRKTPSKMNLGRFAAIAKARGLSDEDIGKVIRTLGR